MGIAIEVVPDPLESLKSGAFYLELIGEVNPKLDLKLAEVSGNSNPENPVESVPIYEFVWSLGHLDEAAVGRAKLWRKGDPSALSTSTVSSAKIYLLFGGMDGWRTTEPIGTVKYMSPAPGGGDLLKRIGNELQGASKVAELVPGGGAASKWMDAAAGLGMSSLPQSKEFAWSIAKVAFLDDEFGILSGVVWTIPESMFKRLNGRLTGGLAVSFQAAVFQQSQTARGPTRGSATADSTGPIRGRLHLKAELATRTRFHRPTGFIRVPEDGYLSLDLELH